jgi:DNA polymerase III subunit delta
VNPASRERPAARSGERIEDLLKEPLAAVWLVLGDETLLVVQAVEALASRALEGGIAAFNRSEGSAEEGAVGSLLQQAATLPMMGGRRAVIIRDIEKANNKEIERILDYVAAPSPTTVLIVSGTTTPPASEGSNPGVRLQNALKKSGSLVRYEIGQKDPVQFAIERADAQGCRLPRAEAEQLVEMVGKDLGLLAMEIDKLSAFVGGQGTITAAEVEEVCSLLALAVIWDLTDAVVRRDAGTALRILFRLLEDGEAPERILPLLTWQFRQLLLLQDCDARGENPYNLGIRMPGAKLAAARNALHAHPLAADAILDRLASANRDMHGHPAGERRVLEGLVLRLVAA